MSYADGMVLCPYRYSKNVMVKTRRTQNSTLLLLPARFLIILLPNRTQVIVM